MALVLSSELMKYYLVVFSKIEKKIIFVPSMGGGGVSNIGHWWDLGMIFKGIFQGLFFWKFFLVYFGGPLGV